MLNLTDKLSTVEERIAARLVAKLGLEPPVDVERLAKSFATVTTKDFPQPIDGLCLDLNVKGKQPKIWIAKGLHRVRRRFTLAHEIGHIRIPWHTGTIIDEIDIPNSREKSRYREMEAEANRFAAELLMPTAWVLRTIERTSHPIALMKLMIEVADVSHPSALFRVKQLGPTGYIGAVTRDGVVAWSGRTKGTRTAAPSIGLHASEIDREILDDERVISTSSEDYVWWKVRETSEIPAQGDEPWREILDRILLFLPETARPLYKSRVNAVIGSAFGRIKENKTPENYYNAALQSCSNRHDRDDNLKLIFTHPDFRRYLIARCYHQSHRYT